MSEDFHGRGRSCPEADVLAGFLDGTLQGSARQEVMNHLETCAECIAVAGEVSRFRREAEDEDCEQNTDGPVQGRRRWVVLSTAAAAAACLTWIIWIYKHPTDPLAIVRTAAARMPVRPVEPRLSGFGFAPSIPRRSGSDDNLAALRIAARSVAESVDVRNRDARSLHARGVAVLLLGDQTSAVLLLKAAARSTPPEAHYWSDLAAARVALGTTTHDERELSLAADDARRAIALSPELPEARFNLALALERLARRDEALRAYSDYLVVDSRSAWAAEVRSRVSQLRGSE